MAVGRRECLSVFGNDYPTRDGTGVRDYIHVVDLATGHLAALKHIAFVPEDADDQKFGRHVYNLSTNRGTSVLEMVSAMEKACGHKINYK